MLNLPPLSLYIHIPWCEKKCPYCDFNSIVTKNRREEEYAKALILDLQQDLEFVQNREIQSIFIGGGTPSLISAKTLESVFNAIHKNLCLSQNCEITMEANPGTTDKIKLNDFNHIGINRLSFGVQSFQDDFLKTLGRIHTSAQAIQAYEQARQVGFNNINLDLMFGLPAQTMQHSLYDLDIATKLAPEHLSWYQLTIEPGTAFYKRPPILPKEDDIFTIYQQGRKFLVDKAYWQYEVSAYATANRQCRHNINYWQFGDYLGIGAGAASKLTKLNAKDNFEIYRKSKIANLNKYIDAQTTLNFSSDYQQVPLKNLLFEFMLNALRLKRGFDINLFNATTGLDNEIMLERIQPFIEKKLIKQENNNLSTTEQGFLWINEILLDFID